MQVEAKEKISEGGNSITSFGTVTATTGITADAGKGIEGGELCQTATAVAATVRLAKEAITKLTLESTFQETMTATLSGPRITYAADVARIGLALILVLCISRTAALEENGFEGSGNFKDVTALPL